MIPKVSVIVPVYNAEEYIGRTIEALLLQTEKEIEIILINDGSKDRSKEICEAYSKKDSRIKVLSQQNKGASAARNRGIEIACGEYLMFCDSDDIVSEQWVAHALIHINDGENILPICCYCHEIEQLGKERSLEAIPQETENCFEYYRFNQIGLAGYLGNALYNRKIVINNNIRMREKKEHGDYNEDLLFALTYIRYVDKIVYTGYADYCYLVREDSLSHSYNNYFEKYEEKYELWSGFIKENCAERQEEWLKDLSTQMQYHFLRALKNDFEKKDYSHFCKIINSEIVNECVNLADGSKENPFEVNCIRNKKIKTLWCYWFLNQVKQRIVRKDG